MELRSLFDAQWSNGMVPHIVFSDDGGDYFPSPEHWRSQACRYAPDHVPTSGICQPPVHATITCLIAEQAPDGGPLARELFERLVAWHDYLFTARSATSPLVEIWHPWESGMDNSPAWDAPLAALRPEPGELPDYHRVDLAVGDAIDRPTDEDYDRYTLLLMQLRDHSYAPTESAGLSFRVHDVLFNSLLAQAERHLARLAEIIGADPEPFRQRGAALSRAIHDELWSAEAGIHHSFDINAQALIPQAIGGAFTALLADPPRAVAEAAVQTMQRDFLVPLTDRALILPTVPVDDATFEPTRYWRGPAWINIMWLVSMGLERTGHNSLAEGVRRGITELVSRGGFSEYYDPTTGVGHGSQQFSWTAALFLDATSEPHHSSMS